MMQFIKKRLISRQAFGLLTIIFFMVAIFVADTITDYEIAVPVFYVAIIIMVIRHVSSRMVIALAGLCMVLTVVSYYFTPTGSHHAGFLNAAISMVIIAITTYLGLKLIAAEAAAHAARDQLLRITRVTSLGELTTSIAHEVNQPLAAIVTSANAAIRWMGQDPPNLDKSRRAIERVIGDANRAGDIITRVRNLSKGEASHKSVLNVNDAIMDIVSLSQAEIQKNGIRMQLKLQDPLPGVLADKVHIQQVVGNLILNGMEAMATITHKDRLLTITSSLDAQSKFVTVSVADTGTGVAHTEEKLFDSFWTTKKNGMGLGLAISRTIIEAHGGTIWAAPNTPNGAIFYIQLPVARK